MNKQRFWSIVQDTVNFMIDKHAEFTDKDGQDVADKEFADALSSSNLLVGMSSQFPENDRLDIAIQHAAFAVTALWLDLQNAGVEDIKTELIDHASEEGQNLN